jgi:hypothetical protein
MRLSRLFSAAASAVMLVCVTTVSHAGLITIDDFSGPLDLYHAVDNPNGKWFQSNALNTAGNNAVVTYSTATNPGELTYSFTTSTNNAVQTTLLRDDYKLENIGDYFQVKMRVPTYTGNTSNVLGGLVLDSSSKTPFNDRTNIIALEMTGTLRVRTTANGVNQTVSEPVFAYDQNVLLRMTLTGVNQVTGSYSLNNGTSFTSFPALNVAGFKAVGVFGGNARSNAIATLVFDDFLKYSVPEPSGFILAMVGFGACVRMGRRRKG